jgi:hypothetical protein
MSSDHPGLWETTKSVLKGNGIPISEAAQTEWESASLFPADEKTAEPEAEIEAG